MNTAAANLQEEIKDSSESVHEEYLVHADIMRMDSTQFFTEFGQISPDEKWVDTINDSIKRQKESPAPVVILKQPSRPKSHFIPLKKWEGTVLTVLEDSFVARLIDQKDEYPDSEAEFSFEEVPQSDRGLIEPGAIFYWNIGYIDRDSGQRMRASVIRFRRIPVWQSEELETAKVVARHLRETIGWE